MKNKFTTVIAAMSFVIAFSLISTTAYAQEQNQTMDKSHKYFAIQNTKLPILII